MKRASLDTERIAALLERISAGDRAAFTALYDETSPLLYGVLMRLLRNPQWALEALQDSYIRVWLRSETYSAEKGDPAAWLIGIARYRALDLLRAQGERAARLECNASDLRDAAVPPRPPDEEAVVLADLDHLRRCLDTLPEAARRSLLLCYYEGYSHHELAEKLNVPLGTVKAWIRRGLVRLRVCLESL